MINRRHITASLLTLVLLAQGALLCHSVDHLVISENSDCALCLKLENQHHAIANQLNLVEEKDLIDEKTVLITVRWNLAQKRHFQARAPPHFS